MTFPESASVENIPGIGPVTARTLKKIGLASLHNVLEWYPRQYIDATRPLPLDGVPTGELVAVQGTILNHRLIRTRSRMTIVEALLADDAGELRLRWFNQPYVALKLASGSRWICIGQVAISGTKRAMLNPILESEPRILPVYRQTAGVSSKQLREYARWTVEHVAFDPANELPEHIRQAEGLLKRGEALCRLHVPASMSEIDQARQTLGFSEAFWFFLRARRQSGQLSTERAPAIRADTAYLHALVEMLPFQLTPGQKRALWDIVQDLERTQPMTRLLNGDVGSGKTAVAGLAAAVMKENGYQTALLVPTAILAEQHAASLDRLLEPAGIKVARYTAKLKQDLESADVVIGTQALLQAGVSLPRLGLIVVDEQHRFGVRQRRLLRERRESGGLVPHVLSMTATPIPRTLALALFSDLKLSTIPDKPAERLPIQTEIIHPASRLAMHERILAELGRGHQVFVICPLVQASEDEAPTAKQEQKTVLEEVERLRRENPEYGTIEVLHGRMKEAEKRAVMERMAAGEIQVLVATSVVEVGIDIPNATVVVIEGAERFGLSQLHQFRGRVGRSDLPSYCFLCPSIRSNAIDQRLRVLAESESGFAIAEADLAMRGPGDLAGISQSGLPEFKMISLGDLSFLQRVHMIAQEYAQAHPEYALPAADPEAQGGWE